MYNRISNVTIDTTVSYLYSTMWIDSLIFDNDKFITFGKVHGTAYYIVRMILTSSLTMENKTFVILIQSK